MQKKYKNLIIVIPSYNEIKTLKKLLLKLKRYNLIIIDDYSIDGTKEFLENNKFFFIRNKKNIGYQLSLYKGFKYAIKKKYKYILTCDADGEHQFEDINNIIKEIKFNYDFIVGNRNFKPILEKLICKLYFSLKGIEDPLCGLKIYKIATFKKIITKSNFDNYLINLINKILNKKIKYINFNIKIKKRIFGKSKVKYTFDYYKKIFKIFLLSFR